MKTLNYLTINELGNVELHGFEMVKDFVYVEMHGEYMLFITHERSETNYCFRVDVNENRIISDERIVDLVKVNKVDNKRFIFNAHFNNYLSTKIDV